ncbi:MAG: hypothetical protein R6X23_12145 [Acidimicrobiia bacterium]
MATVPQFYGGSGAPLDVATGRAGPETVSGDPAGVAVLTGSPKMLR